MFKFATRQEIRSSSLRELAEAWDRVAAGRHFPALTEFQVNLGEQDPTRLVVWGVEGEGSLRKFRAMYQGNDIAAAYEADWLGKTMEMVTPMSLRGISLDSAHECAASGCLVYSIISTNGARDQRIECERLLLPFGTCSPRVDHIIVSLALNSPNTRPSSILKHFTIQFDTLLQVKIRSGFGGGAATTAPAREQRRQAVRRDVTRAARIGFAGEIMTCMVRNLSASGAAIEVTHPELIPDSFGLVLEMETTERPCRVVWRRQGRLGVQFI